MIVYTIWYVLCNYIRYIKSEKDVYEIVLLSVKSKIDKMETRLMANIQNIRSKLFQAMPA